MPISIPKILGRLGGKEAIPLSPFASEPMPSSPFAGTSRSNAAVLPSSPWGAPTTSERRGFEDLYNQAREAAGQFAHNISGVVSNAIHEGLSRIPRPEVHLPEIRRPEIHISIPKPHIDTKSALRVAESVGSAAAGAAIRVALVHGLGADPMLVNVANAVAIIGAPAASHYLSRLEGLAQRESNPRLERVARAAQRVATDVTFAAIGSGLAGIGEAVIARSFTQHVTTATPQPAEQQTGAAAQTQTNTPEAAVPAAVASATPEPNATQLPTHTPTHTPTPTETYTPTPTHAPTETPTHTLTHTPPPTETATALPTHSATPTETATAMPSPTPEPSATPSPTHSPTPDASATPHVVPSSTPEPTAPAVVNAPTSEPSAIPSPFASHTPEPSATPTHLTTHTPTPTPIHTPTETATVAPSATPEPSASPSPANTPTPDASPTPFSSPTPDATATTPATHTPVPTHAVSPTPDTSATPHIPGSTATPEPAAPAVSGGQPPDSAPAHPPAVVAHPTDPDLIPIPDASVTPPDSAIPPNPFAHPETPVATGGRPEAIPPPPVHLPVETSGPTVILPNGIVTEGGSYYQAAFDATSNLATQYGLTESGHQIMAHALQLASDQNQNLHPGANLAYSPAMKQQLGEILLRTVKNAQEVIANGGNLGIPGTTNGDLSSLQKLGQIFALGV